MGNTPAYAGKTLAVFMNEGTGGKHPRLRGEDTPIPLSLRRRFRNTPAYAGKTGGQHKLAEAIGKHPRLRGEDMPTSTTSAVTSETPPLTRGRLQD